MDVAQIYEYGGVVTQSLAFAVLALAVMMRCTSRILAPVRAESGGHWRRS